MDRERATEELELLKDECGDDWLSPKQYFDRVSALDMGIKALKQKDVLDKIREEVKKYQKMCSKDDLNFVAQYTTFSMVLGIIDRYKVGDKQ